MRDVGRVKNKFELKLDSTRAFYLFAGLAAYTALIFVTGVVVGRSRRPEPPPQASMGLPGPTPTSSLPKIEERLGAAQPAPTEEPEIPLGFYENLEEGSGPNSLTGSMKGTARTPTPAPTKTPTPAPANTATPEPVASAQAAAPTPAATAAAGGASRPAGSGAYTVQVIAYNERTQADAAVASLKSKGFDAYAMTAQIPGKGTIHRVRVGRFSTRADAESAAATLASTGMKPLVVSYE